MQNRKKPKVYITRRLPDAVETRMRELFDAELNITDEPRTQPELVAAMRAADVLVPTVTDKIDAALIEQAGPQMKLIANFGNGVDNIDIDAAQKKGITVTNTPNVLSDDTADMTMALMLAVPRRLTEGANVIVGSGGVWKGWSPTWMLGHRIGGKRLGIIGMGRTAPRLPAAPRPSACRSTTTSRPTGRSRHRRPVEATYWDSPDQMLAPPSDIRLGALPLDGPRPSTFLSAAGSS